MSQGRQKPQKQLRAGLGQGDVAQRHVNQGECQHGQRTPARKRVVGAPEADGAHHAGGGKDDARHEEHPEHEGRERGSELDVTGVGPACGLLVGAETHEPLGSQRTGHAQGGHGYRERRLGRLPQEPVGPVDQQRLCRQGQRHRGHLLGAVAEPCEHEADDQVDAQDVGEARDGHGCGACPGRVGRAERSQRRSAQDPADAEPQA